MLLSFSRLQHAEQQQLDRSATQCLWGIGKIAGAAIVGQPVRLRLPFVLVVALPTQCTAPGSLHALPVSIAAEGPKRGGPARPGVQMLRYVWGTVALLLHCQMWRAEMSWGLSAARDAKLISFICQVEASRNKTKHCKS